MNNNYFDNQSEVTGREWPKETWLQLRLALIKEKHNTEGTCFCNCCAVKAE